MPEPAEHESAEHDSAEHEPAEHSPVESANPSIGQRDQPDALRPDTDDGRPHRTLPPDPGRDDTGAEEGPDTPRPTDTPAPDR